MIITIILITIIVIITIIIILIRSRPSRNSSPSLSTMESVLFGPSQVQFMYNHSQASSRYHEYNQMTGNISKAVQMFR